MVFQKTWWYSRIDGIQRGLRMASPDKMKAEERLELRRMLQEALRLVDDLGRQA